jgi:hypothetical protein
MTPEKLVQMIPATGWRIFIPPNNFKDVVAFGLTSDGRVVPLVVADEGDSIVELKDKEFLVIGPIHFKTLQRRAALQNGEYRRLR